jgi:hypothetical protein
MKLKPTIFYFALYRWRPYDLPILYEHMPTFLFALYTSQMESKFLGKVKFSLEQAMSAQRGSRVIALLFL